MAVKRLLLSSDRRFMLFIMSYYAKLTCILCAGVSSVDIKSEADSNDSTECSHDDKPSTGMFAVSDDIFSAVIGLCILCDVCC